MELFKGDEAKLYNFHEYSKLNLKKGFNEIEDQIFSEMSKIQDEKIEKALKPQRQIANKFCFSNFFVKLKRRFPKDKPRSFPILVEYLYKQKDVSWIKFE